MLSSGYYYNDRIDGVVGKNLMKAVVTFQREMDLPLTGFPDDTTLFLLCHLGGGGQS